MAIRETGIPPPPLKAMFDELKGGMSVEWWQWLLALVNGFPKTSTYEVSLNPDSVAANTVVEQVFSVPGLNVYDQVSVSPDANLGIVMAQARVSASGVLAITFHNPTAAPVNPPAGMYRVVATRM